MRKGWVVLGLALGLVGCQPEKVYQGKRTSLWVKQLRESRGPSDRWRAAVAIGEIGPEAREAIPDLIRALQDRDYLVRWAAAKALGRFGPEARAAVPPLQELAAKDPNPPVRREAAEALGKIDPEAARALDR
jgi:HEAT repeat protein